MALLWSQCFSAAFSRGWVFWGQWRDLSEGSTSSSSSHGSKVPSSSHSPAGTPWGSPSSWTSTLAGKTTSLEVEGGLGGKTLPPVRDLLQMPFAESFKTESDQLRLANERPDGRGGGVGEKEPCGLRQQVVLEPGWDLRSWQSPCPPPSPSLRRNCWCPLEGG